MHEFIFSDTNYGEPERDFPNDPPMLDEASLTLAKALGALKSSTASAATAQAASEPVLTDIARCFALNSYGST